MHVPSLSDVLTVEQIIILEEIIDEKLCEAEATLKLHERDSPIGKDIVDETTAYLELIAMQRHRLMILHQLNMLLQLRG